MKEEKLYVILDNEFKEVYKHLEVLDSSNVIQLREFLKTMLEHKMIIDAVISMIDRQIENKFTLDSEDFENFKA